MNSDVVLPTSKVSLYEFIVSREVDKEVAGMITLKIFPTLTFKDDYQNPLMLSETTSSVKIQDKNIYSMVRFIRNPVNPKTSYPE